jgi:hypothetical protein
MSVLTENLNALLLRPRLMFSFQNKIGWKGISDVFTDFSLSQAHPNCTFLSGFSYPTIMPFINAERQTCIPAYRN